VDRHEDPDAHQQRRHTTGPLGVRVSLTITATLMILDLRHRVEMALHQRVTTIDFSVCGKGVSQ
jgi:hypothetical protein